MEIGSGLNPTNEVIPSEADLGDSIDQYQRLLCRCSWQAVLWVY